MEDVAFQALEPVVEELRQARRIASNTCTVAATATATVAVSWWNPVVGGDGTLAVLLMCGGLTIGLNSLEAELESMCLL